MVHELKFQNVNIDDMRIPLFDAFKTITHERVRRQHIVPVFLLKIWFQPNETTAGRVFHRWTNINQRMEESTTLTVKQKTAFKPITGYRNSCFMTRQNHTDDIPNEIYNRYYYYPSKYECLLGKYVENLSSALIKELVEYDQEIRKGRNLRLRGGLKDSQAKNMLALLIASIWSKSKNQWDELLNIRVNKREQDTEWYLLHMLLNKAKELAGERWFLINLKKEEVLLNASPLKEFTNPHTGNTYSLFPLTKDTFIGVGDLPTVTADELARVYNAQGWSEPRLAYPLMQPFK